ncbi:MAG: hypothetical protein HQL50_14475, partial [Magnetococcales bacterium]|nr:hypothetical protein [Magnetococcales bacterium]
SSLQDEMAEQAVTEQVFRRAGMGPEDFFVCLEVGVPEIYDFYFRAARRLGVRRTLFLHLTGNYRDSVQPLAQLNPTVILTIPSILARIWPSMRTFWPPGASPISTVIHMGEEMHPALKQDVEQQWGCRVLSFYGTTEVGGMASECAQQDGSHFDPAMTLLSLENSSRPDAATVEGEALLTTLHFATQPVVKYRIADRLRVTTTPCACGESTPRLTFLERTRDVFVITGVKFRHATILEALRSVAPELTYATVRLEDIPESEGNTLITLTLLESVAALEEDFHQALIHAIFDMDSLHRYGLVRFAFDFQPEQAFGARKIRKVDDRRQWLSTDSHSSPNREEPQ